MKNRVTKNNTKPIAARIKPIVFLSIVNTQPSEHRIAKLVLFIICGWIQHLETSSKINREPEVVLTNEEIPQDSSSHHSHWSYCVSGDSLLLKWRTSIAVMLELPWNMMYIRI